MGARIAWDNRVVNVGAGTSSGDATGYPHDNLLNPMRWKSWKSPLRAQDEWVRFDLGNPETLQVFAAMDAVIHPGGNLRVQANATDVWTSPTIDTTFTVPTTDYTRVWLAWLSAAVTLRYVRFYFTNLATATAQVSLGAVFAGPYLEQARSLSSQLSFDRVDPTVHRFAMGGQRSSMVRPKYHTVSGRFQLQKATARNNLRKVQHVNGTAVPSLLSLDPNDQSLTFYGQLKMGGYELATAADLWNVPIEFTEDVA